MWLVDSHTHIHFRDYDEDREAVLARAGESGVRTLILVGADTASSEAAVRVAESFETIYATVGIHPHDANAAHDQDFLLLRQMTDHPKVVAIGEVGLDFYRNLSPPEIQKSVLERFFALSEEVGLPLVFHIRDAYDAMLEMLKSNFSKGALNGVCHCFSSDRRTMERFLELGLYISFSGAITYKKNDTLREAAKFCPVDRILIETDAPYLAPQAFRGKRNEPAYLIETAKCIANLKDMDLIAFSKATTTNASNCFPRLRIQDSDEGAC